MTEVNNNYEMKEKMLLFYNHICIYLIINTYINTLTRSSLVFRGFFSGESSISTAVENDPRRPPSLRAQRRQKSAILHSDKRFKEICQSKCSLELYTLWPRRRRARVGQIAMSPPRFEKIFIENLARIYIATSVTNLRES